MAREFTETHAIRNLQRYLRQLAFFNDALPELPIDGVYGAETRLAVELFQQSQGLPVTGLVDRQTWDAVYEAYRISVADASKPISIDVFYRQPVPSYIRMGDAGFAVAAIQYMLNEVLSFYGELLQLETDGSYGSQTSDAVQIFQGYAALPQTGEVDLETWNRLSLLYNDRLLKGNQ